jgi:hypothetical protein
MAITTLSNQLVEQKKAETLNAQALRKVVSFREINLIDESTIEYQGHRINITKDAFKSLLKLLGMSQQFAKKFETLFTPEAKSQFINRMKDAMASNIGNMTNITLVVNPINKSVVAFSKAENSTISNGQFIQVAEDIINKHSMDVTNWSVDPTTGLISIDAFNPKAEFGIKGLNDEVFTGGVSFKNSPIGGLQVMPYVNRQWCTNGLTTAMAQDTYTLHSLGSNNMEKFFQHISDARKNNFAPTGFADRVRTAVETPASLSEMRFAHKFVEEYAGERAENWIPFKENMNAYNKLGFDKMTGDQMKMAKTNTSLYSVVNGLTHFATHGSGIIDTNMTDYNASELQVKAGNLFGKKSFDFENSMPNPFAGADLNQQGALLN